MQLVGKYCQTKKIRMTLPVNIFEQQYPVNYSSHLVSISGQFHAYLDNCMSQGSNTILR